MAIDKNTQQDEIAVLSIFLLSGILLTIGFVSAYHMISLDYDLPSTVRAVSPIIGGGFVTLAIGIIMKKKIKNN